MSNFSGFGVAAFGRCIPDPILCSDHTLDGAHHISHAVAYTSSIRCDCVVRNVRVLAGRTVLTTEILVLLPLVPAPWSWS